jgi:tetratricopeptide (TPR) repeat protein
LEILETMGYYPAFEYISASPFFSRALDRWIRGELLVEVGRPEDALAWFATLSEGWGEFLFSGPAHLRQGRVHEALGNADQAIAHFLRFEELWADADPELQSLVQGAREAREGLQASGRPGPL